MKKRPPAPEGSFYNISNELEKNNWVKAHEYNWEHIDGMPRYRWYKYALNAVASINQCDKDFDINQTDFSHLKSYFDAVEWVAQKDSKSLIYIMEKLTPPVTQIVKDKFILHLSKLEYYKSCHIAQTYLHSYPVPLRRTFIRKQKEALKNINTHIIETLKSRSTVMQQLKRDVPEKFKNPNQETQDAFSILLNIDSQNGIETINKQLGNMLWLYKNNRNALSHLFDIKIYAEIKDVFLTALESTQEYGLYILLRDAIQTNASDDYYLIPPYKEPHSYGKNTTLDFDMDEDY